MFIADPSAYTNGMAEKSSIGAQIVKLKLLSSCWVCSSVCAKSAFCFLFMFRECYRLKWRKEIVWYMVYVRRKEQQQPKQR